jgi:hypothetical protein
VLINRTDGKGWHTDSALEDGASGAGVGELDRCIHPKQAFIPLATISEHVVFDRGGNRVRHCPAHLNLKLTCFEAVVKLAP